MLLGNIIVSAERMQIKVLERIKTSKVNKAKKNNFVKWYYT